MVEWGGRKEEREACTAPAWDTSKLKSVKLNHISIITLSHSKLNNLYILYICKYNFFFLDLYYYISLTKGECPESLAVLLFQQYWFLHTRCPILQAWLIQTCVTNWPGKGFVSPCMRKRIHPIFFFSFFWSRQYKDEILKTYVWNSKFYFSKNGLSLNSRMKDW